MRKQNRIIPLLLFLVLGSLVQAGCNSPTLTATLSASKTYIPTTLAASTTPQPAAIDTATPTSSATFSPTPTPTLQPIKLYEPLPTIVQPLDDQQRVAYILHMLTTNGGCELPCLLGIIPGQSSWKDVQSFYAFLGKSSPDKAIYTKYGLTSYHYSFEPPLDDKKSLGWVINFYTTGNEINLIWFDFESQANDPSFTTHYSVKAVTEALGEPTQIDVSIKIWSNPSTAVTYLLNIYYHLNDMWLVFKYWGDVKRLDDHETLVFCPTHPYLDSPGSRFDNSVNLIIQRGNEIYSVGDLYNLGIDHSGGYFFEKATVVDDHSFYQMMMTAKPDEKVCFNSKISLWPILGGAK